MGNKEGKENEDRWPHIMISRGVNGQLGGFMPFLIPKHPKFWAGLERSETHPTFYTYLHDVFSTFRTSS